MTYLSEPCPRCHKKELQQPIKNKNRMYSKCAACGRKSLFVIHHKVGGSKSYSLVRIGRYSLPEFVKKVRSVRLSDLEMKAVERGDLRLIVRNSRITVSA